MSMFTTAMLCVTRTISLTAPLYLIRIPRIIICLIVYLIYLIVDRVLTVSHIEYDEYHMFCASKRRHNPYIVDVLIATKILKILIPLVPSVIGCLVTIYHLKLKEDELSSVHHHAQNQVAVMTVVILTVIFLAASLPHFVLLGFQLNCYLTKREECTDLQFKKLHHLFCFYLPSLVSLFNPLVYLIRIKKLRSYTLNVAKQVVLCRAVDGDEIHTVQHTGDNV